MKRSRTRRVPMPAAAALCAAAALGPAGCFSSNDGPAPPEGDFYFPTALAASPGGKALYVINSNFDLQYTGGTVQALDLETLRAAVPKLWCRLDENGAPDPRFPECAGVPRGDEASDPFPCRSFGLEERSPNEQLRAPGRCAPLDLNVRRDAAGAPDPGGRPILRAAVTLGAFASDAVVLATPRGQGTPGARLGVVVRGDPSLTWLDVDDDRDGAEQGFRLECGQGAGAGRCGAAYLAGKDPSASTRAITLPNEPFAVAATDAGDALAVTHQAGGFVSLFVHGWPGAAPRSGACGASAPGRPELAFVLGGLQGRATSVAALPVPRFVTEFGDVAYRPTFLVTYRDLPQVDRLLYFDDCASTPDRPFLGFGGSTAIALSSSGFDSRGIAIDPGARRAAEAACEAERGACAAPCAEGDGACRSACEPLRACLSRAAAVPVKVYVASRAPSSLLVGETSAEVTAAGTTDLVRFYDLVSLSPGVSSVHVGAVVDAEGRRKTRVFVTCFDSRFIYVYDPERNAIEGIVRTGRGPNTLAFDPALDANSGVDFVQEAAAGAPPKALAYVGHFTDSYVGVLDLDQRHAATYLTLVATVGSPRAPRDSRLAMARRPLASAPLAALLLALAAPAALPGCAQRPQQAPLRSLDRSGRLSLACIGLLGDTTGNPGRPMFECDGALAAGVFDFALQFDEAGRPVADAPHVYALVAQQTRGEVAVIDLSVDPGVTQSILDADLNTPGLNFLPVGAQPVDVVTSGLGGGAFVASAEPGRPGIYGLPANDLRGPALQGEGTPTATLRSWPACRLPSAPGRMLVVESALAGGDPAARLCPSPNPLRDAEPFQQRAPWSENAASVNVVYPGDDGYVPLEGENIQPCGAEGAELPPYCARLACGDEGAQPAPLCKPQLVPRGSNAGAEKLLVTLPERGELLVIDAQTLFERPPGSFDACPIERAVALRVDLPDAPPPAPEAGESCPALPATPAPAGACPARPERSVAYPAAFEARPSAMALGGGRLYVADEGAPVIHVLSLENGCDLRELPPLLPSSVDEPGRPVYTSTLSVSPLTSDQRTFLYAVDRERGGLMAFDVSAGSADRSPLVRERPDLKLFGARDRLAVGGPVREITFVEAAENVLDENGFLRNGACDPDTSSVDPDRGDVFRTTDDYAGGARPTRLRGVFALATLTSGQVRILDVDDLDAACRGPRTAGGFPERSATFSDLPAALTGCESCAIGAYADTLGASDELSCNVVERHELRSGFFFANKSATGLHAPTFQSYPILSFNGASLRTDATEESGPNPKLLGPAVPNPYYSPGRGVLQEGQPGFVCAADSPDLSAVDPDDGRCKPVDANGAFLEDLPAPAPAPTPNPFYAGRPSLDASWSFERGGLPVAADPAPARAERNFVVPDFREPRAHIDQNWTAWFEGPLPGFDGRYADSRLGASEPEAARRGFFDPNASFCGAGVHDRAAARLEGARLLGVPADTSDPGAAAALDRFADRHADYVQIAEELLPPEDPYWVTAASEGRPAAERCDYYSCEATFGPASNPTPARDFVVREAYQDRLFVSDAGPRTLDPDCCFPTLVRYRLRAHNAWTVVGGSVGFAHRTVVDAATGRCVDEGVDPATGAFCDPLVTLRNGRAYEAVNPGVAADPLDADPPPLLLPELVDGRPAADVRWPCRDESGAVALDRRPGQAGAPCFAPSLGDRLTFRNGVLSFIPYQGLEPSRRDMIFSWSMTGGFVPLQIDLGGRGALVAPFAAVFSPELRRLVVTDGGQNGVFSASLATFGFRTYL